MSPVRGGPRPGERSGVTAAFTHSQCELALHTVAPTSTVQVSEAPSVWSVDGNYRPRWDASGAGGVRSVTVF